MNWVAFAMTAALFALYEFILNQGGVWLSQILDISEGTHHFGKSYQVLASGRV